MLTAQASAARADRGTPASPRLRVRKFGLVLGVLMLLGGGFALAWTTRTPARVSVGTIPLPDQGRGDALRGGAQPTRIDITDIGVHAQVVPVGLNARRQVDVPADYDAAGWWSSGAGTGVAGPAVLVGHVDDADGPAVFYRLKDLQPGARITVTTLTGPPVSYVVDAVRQYPDRAFPTETVYGGTRRSALRLLTCGGYNQRTGHYEDNIVVFAHGSFPARSLPAALGPR